MIYQNAMDVIYERRRRRKELIADRRAEVYASVPEIAAVEKRLGETGMMLLNAVA